MKKAYLFGAAALLILLIVVAYIASNRQEEEAVCPPQVVGPTAEPVVKILNFDDADDEVLSLDRGESAFGERDPTEIRIPTLTYVNRPQKYKERLVVGPPEYTHQPRAYEAQVENYPGPDIPMGGPQPLSPLFGSEACPYVPITPFSPFTPAREPEIVASNDSKLDGPMLDTSLSDADFNDVMNLSRRSYVKSWNEERAYLLEAQREYMMRLSENSPLRKSFLREQLRSASLNQPQRLIDLDTGKPIDEPTADELFERFLRGE